MTHPLIELYGPILPEAASIDPSYRRAPKRRCELSARDSKLAVENALRYVPETWKKDLKPEFEKELLTYGRIYAYRFRPEGRIYAQPIDSYKSKCLAGASLQLMMDNNLDFEIALYPYELVTYGETGQVCQNWLQYIWIKHYLQTITETQTLVVMSGHPLGLFPSLKNSPRAIVTNAMMIGEYNDPENWARAAAIGVANYGQMTAGGWMYIGPQGIVHGTYNTLMIAARKVLGGLTDLKGKLFVTSGLGGMSGAQGKAIKIAGGVGIIAEVDPSRIETRHSQGWVDSVAKTSKSAFETAHEYMNKNEGHSIAYQGNVVDLLEYAIDNDIHIDLLSDQTSCHAVYEGGYCPTSMNFEERTDALENHPEKFKQEIDKTLKQHYQAIKKLHKKGTYFFDYGNSFMKAVYDSGILAISKNGVDDKEGFIWPSYVEDLLGPELFDYGYGPFRWVCLSMKPDDLRRTDQAASKVISSLREKLRYQDIDNKNWVDDADKNQLVVGSQARILYQDAIGRMSIALEFNKMVREKQVGPIMLGRDHHDTGGTDSPFRETSNIKDGSNIMADMATQCFAGNCARGMTLVALHNGGGVGIGKSVNGGYGLLLDGSTQTDEIIQSALPWDVMVGVARRAWAGNKNALTAVHEYSNTQMNITIPSKPLKEGNP